MALGIVVVTAVLADHAARLGIWPTPLQTIDEGRLYVKREDLCGFAFGGSKVRALEALLARAQAREVSTLVVGGRRDSNWVALAAIAAARHGMKCHAVFDVGDSHPQSMRIVRHHGARVHLASPPGAEAVNAEIRRIAGELGPTALGIPRAGASATGTYGYASCAREVIDQLPQATAFDLVVALGSGGFAAGLLIGLEEAFQDAPDRDFRVVAVPVSKSAESAHGAVSELVRATAAEGLTTVEPAAALDRLRILPRAREAAAGASRAQNISGVMLDPVFAGPAWHAYFAQRLAGPRGAVLMASGGLPAVFDSMNGSSQ